MAAQPGLDRKSTILLAAARSDVEPNEKHTELEDPVKARSYPADLSADGSFRVWTAYEQARASLAVSIEPEAREKVCKVMMLGVGAGSIAAKRQAIRQVMGWIPCPDISFTIRFVNSMAIRLMSLKVL